MVWIIKRLFDSKDVAEEAPHHMTWHVSCSWNQPVVKLMPSLVCAVSSLEHHQLEHTKHVITAPQHRVCPAFAVAVFVCVLDLWIYMMNFCVSVTDILSCSRSSCPLWMSESVSQACRVQLSPFYINLLNNLDSGVSPLKAVDWIQICHPPRARHCWMWTTSLRFTSHHLPLLLRLY